MKKLILLAFLFLVQPCFAADHYVRAGASGGATGADWTNAWAALPSALTRGDTYYIADGTYGAYDFDDAVSGTTVITVKKAVVASHGTETGWDSAYGDGQAEFTATGTPITVSSNYWVIDGVVGSADSGHGFKATVTGTTDATRGIRITATSNVTVSHWEVTSTNPAGVADAEKQDGIYSVSASNVTIDHCYIHNWKRCGILLSGVTVWNIEHNYIYHTYSTSGAHGQAIQAGPGAVSDVEIRYNTFKDCHGTGVIVALDNTFDDFRIHGNIFWEDEASAAIGIYSTSQAIGTTSGDTGTNFKVHNNTFIGMDGRDPQPSGGLDMNGTATGNEAYNNIWLGCTVTFDAVTHDYNASDDDLGEANDQTIASSIFTNYAGGVFTLASATNAGTTLSSPYNADMLGNTRGSDGTWDRGAYEYQSLGDMPGRSIGTGPAATIGTGPGFTLQ